MKGTWNPNLHQIFRRDLSSVHNFHNSKIKALEEINKTDVTPDLENIHQNVKETKKQESSKWAHGWITQ